MELNTNEGGTRKALFVTTIEEELTEIARALMASDVKSCDLPKEVLVRELIEMLSKEALASPLQHFDPVGRALDKVLAQHLFIECIEGQQKINARNMQQ